MKWRVSVVDGRTSETVATIYCRAADSQIAKRIAERVAKGHYQIKKRCRYYAAKWCPSQDKHMLASGYVAQAKE